MSDTSNLRDNCDEKYIHIENFILPNGGIYIGDAIQKPTGDFEICGKGKLIKEVSIKEIETHTTTFSVLK